MWNTIRPFCIQDAEDIDSFTLLLNLAFIVWRDGPAHDAHNCCYYSVSIPEKCQGMSVTTKPRWSLSVRIHLNCSRLCVLVEAALLSPSWQYNLLTKTKELFSSFPFLHPIVSAVIHLQPICAFFPRTVAYRVWWSWVVPWEWRKAWEKLLALLSALSDKPPHTDQSLSFFILKPLPSHPYLCWVVFWRRTVLFISVFFCPFIVLPFLKTSFNF